MADSDQSAEHQQRPPFFTRMLPLLAALLLAGCLGHGSRPDAPFAETVDLDGAIVMVPLAEKNEAAGPQPTAVIAPQEVEIWRRLRAGFQLEAVRNPRVQHEIRRLQRAPNAFRALMARSEPYLYYILDEIQAAGLPTELALLPAVESGFQPHAYSGDGAAGLWQFMPATGQMLGLEQDWWFDRRRTVRASTAAAIEYLTRLHARFDGDWLNALAAYNAGAGTVRRAIRIAGRHGDATDFWSLDLPGETEHYVPRLLALATVVADPEAYGLDLPEILDRPYFAAANTGGQIDLNIAAELAGISVEELLALNGGHKRWSSQPDGPHELLLPITSLEVFEEGLAALPPDKRLRWRHHRIRRGDSLIRIAREHGVSVEAIRRSNGLVDSRIRAGEDLVIPLSDELTLVAATSNQRSRQRLHYRVRRGDSLYTIARRFQVTVAELKQWNRVGRYIQPGERLTLFIDPDA